MTSTSPRTRHAANATHDRSNVSQLCLTAIAANEHLNTFTNLPVQLYTALYVAPFSHSLNSLFLTEVLEDYILYMELLEVLSIFNEDIININSISKSPFHSPSYMLTSKKRNKALPLEFYGDGMKKALYLMSSLVKAKNGILLIDEVETGLHTKVLTNIFNWIFKVALKLNVQLFITTHSVETLTEFIECAQEFPDKMRIITLYRQDCETIARILNAREADKAKQIGLELR